MNRFRFYEFKDDIDSEDDIEDIDETVPVYIPRLLSFSGS